MKDCLQPSPQIVLRPKWQRTRLEIRRRNEYSLLPSYTCSREVDLSQTMSKCTLFETLKLKNNPHHHWSDNSGWAMAEAIERVVLKRTKEVMQVANFFSLSCDEVTSVDCQSCISVHDYVVIDWKQMPVFLTLERVIEGGTTDNLIVVIVNAARAYGGLTEKKIREKLITFGQMGFLHFKVLNPVSLYNLSTSTLLSWWVSIAWHTARILLSKPYPSLRW